MTDESKRVFRSRRVSLICIRLGFLEHLEGFAHHLEGFIGRPVFSSDLSQLDVLGHHVHDPLEGPFSDFNQFLWLPSRLPLHDFELDLPALVLFLKFFDPHLDQWFIGEGRSICR